MKNRYIKTLRIRVRPGNRCQGYLILGDRVFPCALGRGGISPSKREGDGATPIGSFGLLYGYIRADRNTSYVSGLPMKSITQDMGWCDTAGDRNYNREVNLPYPASHEVMLRDDRLYDICVVLNYNFGARMRHRGSAIFLHQAKPGFPPTEGCIALEPKVMRRLLPLLSSKTRLIVEV